MFCIRHVHFLLFLFYWSFIISIGVANWDKDLGLCPGCPLVHNGLLSHSLEVAEKVLHHVVGVDELTQAGHVVATTVQVK